VFSVVSVVKHFRFAFGKFLNARMTSGNQAAHEPFVVWRQSQMAAGYDNFLERQR
jgi:hypothetical protein